MNARFLVARKQRKISQLQLAQAVGCLQSDISRIENAGWIPPTSMRDAIAEQLGVDADVLFAESAPADIAANA